MKALLIAGTDTDAGKTVVTSALAAYWLRYQPTRRLGILKPIQTGVGDREHYSQMFGYDLAEVNPVSYAAPLAPPLAAAQEGKIVDLERVWQGFEAMCQTHDFVLVEGLGGLGSPVTHETTVADLAWDWQLPVVLVVPVKLGAIGQAVANVALARQCRLHLKGIVLNCIQPCSTEDIANWAAPELMQSLTQVPVLGCLPYLDYVCDRTTLAQAAATLDLEQLLPGVGTGSSLQATA